MSMKDNVLQMLDGMCKIAKNEPDIINSLRTAIDELRVDEVMRCRKCGLNLEQGAGFEMVNEWEYECHNCYEWPETARDNAVDSFNDEGWFTGDLPGYIRKLGNEVTVDGDYSIDDLRRIIGALANTTGESGATD